ncbi:RNA polymerase sigma-54 factor [Atopobacter sp. AH10]|uniref:RNA polymerase factor sigma-54 n=1 Tax=Atopobacter sp. AH10 TaxID=2315861 RepID=UPI000EF2243E|nr:RNA polymerase factor sigma-54 [Atopobacter sp. AH10]RLK62907.1 RNA polymerase sigma-54 factor [Atopobacter sp. AH10]
MPLKTKQKLQQKQQLKLSADLTQAIELLQYNVMDLKDFLTDKSLDNPFLQVENTHFLESSYDSSYLSDQHQAMIQNIPDKGFTTLKSYLTQQAKLNYRDTPIRDKVFFLIDQLDDSGRLHFDIKAYCSQEREDPTLYQDALALLQELDPAGVGAKDLKECLELQINRDPYAPKSALTLLSLPSEQLQKDHLIKITENTGLELEEVQSALSYLQQLDPYPGHQIQKEATQFTYPDLTIHVQGNTLEWQINQDILPKIKFDLTSFNQIKQACDQDTLVYLNKQAKDFDWLIQALSKREATLGRLAQALIHFQAPFFLKQQSYPLGLNMKDLANYIDVHESTVSRIVQGKYLQFNGRNFPLKYFFPQKLAHTEGVSIDEVKAMIKDLITKENPHFPLSDQAISDILKDEGLPVARRTVAKYRKSLNYPSASHRKALD